MFEMYVYDRTNAMVKHKNVTREEIAWFRLTRTENVSRIDVYDVEGFAFRINCR